MLLIALSTDAIHLWLAYYDQMHDARLSASYRAILSSVEKQQEQRFRFEIDRVRYLVTRVLVRTVLARYLSTLPEELIFATNAYGRPEIANLKSSAAGLSFNVSHTDRLILLGVTKGRALGLDVENVCTRQVSIDIVDRFFAPTEVAALAKVPPNQKQDRILQYWTLKESYIKARGAGLSIPLDKFSFSFRHDQDIEIAIDPELADDATRWQFFQFRPTPEFLVAVCTERVDTRPPSLVVMKSLPSTGVAMSVGSEAVYGELLICGPHPGITSSSMSSPDSWVYAASVLSSPSPLSSNNNS